MKRKGSDNIRLSYIALIALIGAIFFVILAGGALIGAVRSAKGSGTKIPAEAANTVTDEAPAAGEAAAGEDAAANTDTALLSGEGTVSPDAAAGADSSGADVVTDAAASDGTGEGSSGTAAGTSSDGGVVTVKISAAGDFTLGTDVNFDYDSSFNAYYDDYAGYPGWFLENVRKFFEDDDLTIVNFEGVLSDDGEREDKQYAFKGRPEFVDVLTEGSVEACNIANNHSGDYGHEAYEDTKRILANAGIQVFGYDRSVVVDVNGIKVGLTGTMELFDGMDCLDSVMDEIQKVKDEGAELIICSFHWGDEGEYHHYEIQEELAHAAIDAGADLVLGHHPHRIQEMEKYNGKFIFYSLGNFCFGGHPGPSDMDSFIAQQTFTFINGELQEVKDSDVRIIPCRISSTSEYNNYQPTPFDEDADGYARVIEKLKGNWG